MKEYFLIAKVISVIGNEGFVRISSFSDFPDRFFELKKVFIDFFGDKKQFTVESVRKQKNNFIIKFKNFDNEIDAEILIDKEIFVDSENLVELPKDHFFVHDLIGSKVYRNDCEFGTIKDVLNYPANDVYVIEDAKGEEILIPAVSEFIENFDPQNKILVLKPGDSFYEDDEN